MEIYSIGFTQTAAERFFQRLSDARIERVLDVRLNNSSQLAGFAKAQEFRSRTALLCSEPTAEQCRRRLVIEYLAADWPAVSAIHL